MTIHHFFRAPGISVTKKTHVLKTLQRVLGIAEVETEFCYNVETEPGALLSPEQLQILAWLLSETFEQENFSTSSFLEHKKDKDSALFYTLLEVGPRLSFSSAFSTNAVSICHSCKLTNIKRIELSRRYLFSTNSQPTEQQISQIVEDIHDKMTECLYPSPLTTFDTGVSPKAVRSIPVLKEGRVALERLNKEMGLAFDEHDINLYTDIFQNVLKRDPTDVECFDIAQSNSEHSRHWFFTGNMIIDGEAKPLSLMKIVKNTLEANRNNSIIAFCDNSSGIKGYNTHVLVPQDSRKASQYVTGSREQHIIFTAETHNFPSGVAPFPGAETGTGGRIRDTHATGRGSIVLGATVGYCVGNLQIPGYELPWEDKQYKYPGNFAAPLKIEIEASNGASDYGNKFGEPVIQGFTRSFGLRLPNGERREWIKPIMFSGGVGHIDGRHITKGKPEKGMTVVKAGGPAYRIGLGGGAASSVVGGQNSSDLDFSAVQRGDAQMGQKLNRVVRGCVELDVGGLEKNPIVSIHDQGAGGAGNVLKEIVDPLGAKIEVDKFVVGDPTLSVLEIWGAEYQEQDALLIGEEGRKILQALSERERLPVAFVGTVTGDGQVVLHDSKTNSTPVNLPLERVLGKMPPKTFTFQHENPVLQPLVLPSGASVSDHLGRVLRLLSVGSKRFLTNKVDRSVTGLIAQQQCVGGLHTPVADVAVVGMSYTSKHGAAISVGEQPIKGLLDPKGMAGLTVGEALTNLVWANITSLEDVKCSGNWMWAAKLKGEGASMYDACVAMHDCMVELGIAIDGGKDSLSMAAHVNGEVVKCPGTLVVSTYVTCKDITKTVTPDLKLGEGEEGILVYIDLGEGKYRLGGSALAQVYTQVGDAAPQLSVPVLKTAFAAVQELVEQGLISAGHDRSDGGLAVTLIEMALAGNRGIEVSLKASPVHVANNLFAEELGLVMEISSKNISTVQEILKRHGVNVEIIGKTVVSKGGTDNVIIKIGEETVLNEPLSSLRVMWEETSYQLELLQANPKCVQQEWEELKKRGTGGAKGPGYKVTFTPEPTADAILLSVNRPRVAIVREEGSNGDREMAGAFWQAGFEPWDITMTDLAKQSVSLDIFRGVAFVGGFSYADVLDSAKGWAGAIRFNPVISAQFDYFYDREDTFSFGICNGCQLMALLGWVPWRGLGVETQPRFIHNDSGRYESRFSTVVIGKSPSIFTRGMEGSVLGVWSAHGEGKLFCKDESVLQKIEEENLVPLRYVNDEGEPTEVYPYNPSGTPKGIASLCSPNGRHMAMMPHPERTFLKWHWPYWPQNRMNGLTVSPWVKLFQNAYLFCTSDK
eukprot:Phypoly_transcript_00815.p1 GENE.Phypoly_transcript_00815~~Phypoly_transcript_00815.p1  ORF type:complete len:1325 (+),score=193.92 Phypoly_transcript_00815:32-4006(+)